MRSSGIFICAFRSQSRKSRPLPSDIELRTHFPAFFPSRLGFDRHDKIDATQTGGMSTKAFPDPAFEPLPHDGKTNPTTTDRHPETRMIQAIGRGDHGNDPGMGARAIGKHPRELPCLAQTEVGSESIRRRFGGWPMCLRIQAQRRARPLARRVLKMRRPARVAILARNPCLRLRLRLLG